MATDVPIFQRKYATLQITGTTAIKIPIIKRGVLDFAVSADWTPAAGDVKIAINGTAPANVANLPTAVAAGTGGFWEFILTLTETSCQQAVVTVVDAATKAVEDTMFIVEFYGNASAMYQWDMSVANLPSNVTQWIGSGVSAATVGIPSVNAVRINNILTSSVTTVNANQGTTQPINFTGAGASAFAKADTVDWNGTAVSTPSTAGIPEVNLKNIANAAVSTSTAQLGVNTVNVGGTAQTARDLGATLGVAGAGLTALGDTRIANLDAAVSSRSTYAGGAVASVTGAVGSVTGSVGSVAGAVGSVTGNVGGNVVGSVASVTAGVTVSTNNDKTAYSLTVAPPTAVQIRTEMDANSTKLVNLDATVSSRMATFAYTVPPTATVIADTVLRRSTANVEASSDGDTLSPRSLYGAIARLSHKISIVGGIMTVTKADDTTALTTATLTSDSSADPVTGIDPA